MLAIILLALASVALAPLALDRCPVASLVASIADGWTLADAAYESGCARVDLLSMSAALDAETPVDERIATHHRIVAVLAYRASLRTPRLATVVVDTGLRASLDSFDCSPLDAFEGATTAAHAVSPAVESPLQVDAAFAAPELDAWIALICRAAARSCIVVGAWTVEAPALPARVRVEAPRARRETRLPAWAYADIRATRPTIEPHLLPDYDRGAVVLMRAAIERAGGRRRPQMFEVWAEAVERDERDCDGRMPAHVAERLDRLAERAVRAHEREIEAQHRADARVVREVARARRKALADDARVERAARAVRKMSPAAVEAAVAEFMSACPF